MIKVDVDYHVIEIKSSENMGLALDWCKETLKPGTYFYKYPYIYFESKYDHMMFLLRWGR